MKYLLLFFTLISLQGFAQQWPETNSQWVYCRKNTSLDNFNPNNNYGALVVNYVADTLINGKIYNISSTNSNGPYTTEDGSYFTRFSNDTIYRLVNSNEYFFFSFNLNLNDIYTTYRSIGGSSDTSCTSILTLKVVDSTSTNVNQETVTKWTLEDTVGIQLINGGPLYYHQFVVYEKYGFGSFPWLSPNGEEPNCIHAIDYPYTIFSGYSDVNTTAFGGYCPVAGIENQSENQISVFPNPVHDNLNIVTNAEEVSTILVYDVNGKIILSSVLSQYTTQINTSHLNNGLYFYKVLNNQNSVVTFGKFLKN